MRNFIVLIMLFCANMVFAQCDVTKFMGIPVDGTKAEMIQKLKAKGFTPRRVGTSDFMEGEFNGTDIKLFIVTNNNKVYRIMLCDKNNQDEANIKIRFNNLVSQFENNEKYTTVSQFKIPDSEDIGYNMKVNNKIYEAVFYQSKIDTLAQQNKIREELLKKYTPEQLENPTPEITQEAVTLSTRIGIDIIDMFFKKSVWFRICEIYGKYYIAMYYDNEYNKAHGEDL